MLLGIKKELQEKYVTLFVNMQKLITNTWKIMIKISTVDLTLNLELNIILTNLAPKDTKFHVD